MTDRTVQTLESDEAIDYFKENHPNVLTFVGFFAAGYEDLDSFSRIVTELLKPLPRDVWVINAGATPEGIGGVYPIAKDLGFTTSGIISTVAMDYEITLSSSVDEVIYVPDKLWGGLLPESSLLSPTSEAMVSVSKRLVGIGGGEIARDELLAARTREIQVDFWALDMQHRRALERAAEKDLPPPTRFSGEAAEHFAKN